MSDDDVQQWITDLEAAGWSRHKGLMTVWRSPNGALYRGPYGAWRAMKDEREQGAVAVVDDVAER